MKKNNKQRLFEVMGRLDKTFKPKLNENFEIDDINVGGEEEAPVDVPAEINNEPKTLSAEEKLEALTSKIDSLYAMVHGDEEGEEEIEGEPEGIEGAEENEPEEGENEIAESKPKVPVNAIPTVGK